MKSKLILKLLSLLILGGCTGNSKKPNENKQPMKMSSSVVKIISTNPAFEPTKVNQINAQKFLANFYPENQISLEITKDIEFVDQGENFESVSCNLCKRRIEIDDWQDAMEFAHKRQFTELNFNTKCCYKTTSLNDLIYKFPAGFAKCVLSITDADVDLSESQIEDLEKILGTKLRIILAHY